MARLKQKILVSGMTVAFLLPLTSCTVNPITNEKFGSFNSCMAANILLATAVAGVGRKVAIETGISKNVANATAVTGALLITYTAWQKCAQAFQEITYRDVVLRDAMPQTGPGAPSNSPTLRIDELSIVATKWGEPLVTTARFTLFSSDGKKVDIPVVTRRIIATPPVPPETEPKKISFSADLVAKQGSRTADVKLETPPDLPTPSPKDAYKFIFEIEADGMKASNFVQFYFDGKKHSAAIAATALSDTRPGSKDASANRPAGDGTGQRPKPKQPVTKPKNNNTGV